MIWAPPSMVSLTVAASLAVLAAVQPLPGTGALRSLGQILLLICSLILLWRSRRVIGRPSLSASGILLGILSLWLLYQSAVVAPTPQQSLLLLFGEWGKTLLLLVMGIWLATAPQNQPERAAWLSTAIFVGYFSHTLMTLGYQGWYHQQVGHWNPGASLLGGYGYVALLVDNALALLLADAATRICFGHRLLPLATWLVPVAIAFNLIAMILLSGKTGLVMTALLLVTAGAVAIRNSPLRGLKMLLPMLGVLVLVIAVSLSFHNRWDGLGRSIAVGLDTTGNLAWLDPENPLPPGIDESFYMRMAWAKIGLEGVATHPLGIGYGTDAFGRYVAEVYGKAGLISSHSGWINFTLANGIPGILLFLALAGFAFAKGVQAFRAGHGVGLVLGLLILNYIGRCAFDDQLSASRLQGFALVTGIFWGLMTASGELRPARPSADAAS